MIGLYDHESGELQTAKGEWWPVLNDDHHILDTVRSRTRSGVYERTGRVGPSAMRKMNAASVVLPAIPKPITPSTPALPQMVLAQPCNVFALVANGYRDKDNTFDDDADGMYEVLRGLGLPDDQIVYVSPYKSQVRDYLTSRENLKKAIKDINGMTVGGNAREVVFFLSTHGGTLPSGDPEEPIFFVQLKARGSGNHRLEFKDLTSLICSANTDTLTIVVEACKSGHIRRLIEADEVCKDRIGSDGLSIRMLLSAGETRSSSADLDGNDSNREDVGSETVWGYIEAFGTSGADFKPDEGQPDGKISFCEAVTYAKKFDGGRGDPEPVEDFCSIENLGEDWKAVASLVESDTTAAHSCLISGPTPKVEIVPDSVRTKRRKKVGSYGTTQVAKRCTNTPVRVTLKNLGGSVIPVATLRLFGSVLNDDGSPNALPEPYANLAIVSALKRGEERTYELTWGVRPIFKKGQRVALYATLDSPQAPVAEVRDGADLPTEQLAWEPENQTCRCEVSVVKRCFPIIGCSCRKYAGPEIRNETNGS